MHGPRQTVGITSSPPGAVITLNGVSYGRTPVITKLKRDTNYIVKLELPGYEAYETTLIKHIDVWIWGNIISGGIIGLAVDSLTGSLYNLTPGQVEATFTKSDDRTALIENGTLCVAVVLKSDPTWEKIGTLKRKEY